MFLDDNQLELIITVMVFGMGLGLAGTASILERKPRKSLEPRLIPTTLLMFAGILVSLLALIHIANLLGIKTGR
jgi:hypothetical protein